MFVHFWSSTTVVESFNLFAFTLTFTQKGSCTENRGNLQWKNLRADQFSFEIKIENSYSYGTIYWLASDPESGARGIGLELWKHIGRLGPSVVQSEADRMQCDYKHTFTLSWMLVPWKYAIDRIILQFVLHSSEKITRLGLGESSGGWLCQQLSKQEDFMMSLHTQPVYGRPISVLSTYGVYSLTLSACHRKHNYCASYIRFPFPCRLFDSLLCRHFREPLAYWFWEGPGTGGLFDCWIRHTESVSRCFYRVVAVNNLK